MGGLGSLFADSVPPPSFWNGANNSGILWAKILLTLLLVSLAFFFLKDAGPRVRMFVVGGTTFLAGAFYVAFFFVPTPLNRQPSEMPQNFSESVSFWFDDAVPLVGNIANIIAAFLLGLGVYSVLTIHLKRLYNRQRDWGYSIVLLFGIVIIAIFGYWNWNLELLPGGQKLDDPANWGPVTYARDFLFDGLLQQMDAAMFSIIAFYILSAAYRAFRIRSIEATVLLGSALIMMVSLMGAVEFMWNQGFHQADPNSIFSLTEISKWVRDCFQTPALRAIDFGVGIGSLAMGLRLWLSLEKQGAN